MTKHENKKYKKGNNDKSTSQVIGESEVTKNRTWFVMMGKD